MNRCYAKAVAIAAELRNDPSLTVLDPREAQTTFSTYFTILPAGVTLVDTADGRGRIEWNRPMEQRWCVEVRVSDHKVGHALDFTSGASVPVAVTRIQKHIAKARG